jgi:hypothetical protein
MASCKRWFRIKLYTHPQPVRAVPRHRVHYRVAFIVLLHFLLAAKDGPTVEQLLNQLEEVRAGKQISADTVVNAAKLFKDEITLDNLPRHQVCTFFWHLLPPRWS